MIQELLSLIEHKLAQEVQNKYNIKATFVLDSVNCNGFESRLSTCTLNRLAYANCPS